ncbi:MAG: polysaccharide biosynthesis C-terminal domain-containing protein, partial [Bacteroidales bacterium]|nr:polysaccharide biosynthesis C-terminal domain-containing protein [Bacteroidales bacterium]
SSPIIYIIVISMYFSMLKEITVMGLSFVKRTRIIGRVIIFITILNIVLNIIFIPLMGIIGAALATLLSQIGYFILVYFFAQKYYFIPYELKKVFLVLFVGIILFCLSKLTVVFNIYIAASIKLVLLFTFPFILYLFNFYEAVEIASIKGFYKKWKNSKNWKSNLFKK